MSRLVCLGKSSTGSQKQLAVEATSTHAETHKPKNGNAGKKTITDKPRSLLARPLHRSVQASCQETQKSGSRSGDVLNKDAESSPKESINLTPRVEKAQLTAVPDDEPERRDLMKAQPPDSAVTVAEPLSTHEPNGDEEQSEKEDVEDEDLKAPVELIIEFLRAVMDRDFQLASKLCQMILIYEPDNPEASEFLPLIQKKLLEEQEAEESTDEDDDDDEEDEDDDDDSGSDEEASQSSSCSSSSCSSSSPSDEEEAEEEKRWCHGIQLEK